MKKLLFRTALTLGTLGVVVGGAAAFSAFEAHIINVTATIENALAVDTPSIVFGTVFPQEQLDRILGIRLSDSFEQETGVDDVDYIIRQKPKCAWTTRDGQQILSDTQSGHVDDEGKIICPAPVPSQPPQVGAVYGSLPLLCRYLSKHPIVSPGDPSENDGSLDAFHSIGGVKDGKWIWNDVRGHLAKSQNDHFDLWNIDLKVPCFGGFCAQDWADFVRGINPLVNNPDDYVQPIVNEHKIFGCDLWIEVTGVSRLPHN